MECTMMATKNNPGQFDCYANADPDEPMFVLLGRDKHAPTLVWLWATLRELAGEDEVKVAEARACCTAMIGWAADRKRPSAGLGQAVLAALFELIRAANYSAKDIRNAATDVDVVRLFLAESKFEGAKA